MTSVQNPSTAPESEATVNFYESLGLDRDEATAEIRAKLDDLALGWAAKATRAGSLGEQARAQLLVVDQAKEVFATDDTRELYDLSLVRKREAVAEADIDWLTRAWSYYFIHDDGAAGVAARKAREKEPNNAMAYVVDAWVKLRQDELRQAKDAADEAFVLDELGEDTCDVHHVRGVVFYQMRDVTRAIQSFERALTKAAPSEVAELRMRLALAEARRRGWQAARTQAEAGLSQPELLAGMVRGELERTYSEAVLELCDSRDDSVRSVTAFTAAKEHLAQSGVTEPSKTLLSTFITQNIDRHAKLRNLRTRIADLEAQESRLNATIGPGGRPVFPLIALGVGVVSLLLIGVWGWFFVVAAIAGVRCGVVFYKISACNQRDTVIAERRQLEPQVDPLQVPIQLARR